MIIRINGSGNFSMVDESFQGRIRNGINGFGTNKLIDIEGVWKVRIFSGC